MNAIYINYPGEYNRRHWWTGFLKASIHAHCITILFDITFVWIQLDVLFASSYQACEFHEMATMAFPIFRVCLTSRMNARHLLLFLFLSFLLTVPAAMDIGSLIYIGVILLRRKIALFVAPFFQLTLCSFPHIYTVIRINMWSTCNYRLETESPIVKPIRWTWADKPNTYQGLTTAPINSAESSHTCSWTQYLPRLRRSR